MPQVNLSKLSVRELRAQLDMSRARGDAKLAYTILEEMAARRDGRGEKRKPEPRIITFDADPEAVRDEEDIPPMPNWRSPEVVATAPATPEQEPEPEVPPEAPLEAEPPPAPAPLGEPEREPHPDPVAPAAEAAAIDDAPPAADEQPGGFRLESHAYERRRQRPRTGVKVAVGYTLGVISGLAIGWIAFQGGLLDGTRTRPQGNLVADVVGQPVLDTPALPPAAAPPAAPVADTDAIVPEQPPVTAEAPPALAEAPEAPVVDSAPETEPATPASTATATGDCAALQTPADRTICADSSLQQLQRDLRRAYARALEAHTDRELLRQRQVAWAIGRNNISDRAQLARIYQERIARLDAATAAAEAQR